jgi:hypothetical protein
MPLPTWSQIKKWDAALGGLKAVADTAGKLADAIGDGPSNFAKTIRDSIYNLEWTGKAKDAADGRADREHADLSAVATAYRNLATAVGGAYRDLSADTAALKAAVAAAGTGFTLAEDDPGWTITGKPSHTTADDLHSDLLRLAQQFLDHNNTWAPQITAANDALTRLTPAKAGLNVAEAEHVADDAKSGHLTPQDIALLQQAQLTPDQLTALHNGQPVNIPKGQYDFLNSLMRKMDGMSAQDIDKLGDSLAGGQKDQFKGNLANAFRIMSNPQVHAAAADGTGVASEHGRLGELPDQIQKLLTEKPANQGTKLEWINDPQGLKALNNIMGYGDRSIQGCDINRAIIKQAAEIADGNKDANIGEKSDINKILNTMLTNAGDDKTAVHDAMTGQNMDVTCDHGGHYDADSHVVALLNRKWGKDDSGINHMFNFLSEDAASDKAHLNTQAGETANAVAHTIANHPDIFADAKSPMGSTNPNLTNTLAKGMAPYLANFVNAPEDMRVNHAHFDPFPRAGEEGHLQNGDLAYLFSALDSDPRAADIINTNGQRWSDYLAYQAGADSSHAGSLGATVAHLNRAMASGIGDQIANQANQANYQATLDYNDKTAFSDSISAWAGAVPGVGSVAGPAAATVDAYFKDKVLQAPGDPNHPLPDSNDAAELKKLREDIGAEGLRTDYDIYSGYAHTHPDAVPSPPTWDSVNTAEGRQTFDDSFDALKHHDETLGDFDAHYESAGGPRPTTISDPDHSESSPTTSNRPTGSN